MGLFTDILKGLPENALLRDKVADAEKRYAALETENAILKDDLRDAKAEIAKLKNQIEKVPDFEIDKTDVEILLLTANAKYANPYVEFFADTFQLHPEVVKHRLNKLTKHKYLLEVLDENGFPVYQLHYRGRDYLIKNNLI